MTNGLCDIVTHYQCQKLQIAAGWLDGRIDKVHSKSLEMLFFFKKIRNMARKPSFTFRITGDPHIV